ncbi:indoleamine 2,3-dioxygenase, partial [Phenoliferia sp. Uapishka_3]
MLLLRTLNSGRRALAFNPRLVRGLAVHAATTPKHTEVSNPLAAPVLLENMTAAQRNAAAMFTMSKARGFLPRQDPLAELPSQFAVVESLLRRMTIRQPDGSRGLLAKGEFGSSVLRELDGSTTEAVLKAIETKDQPLISALFRDYCFMTSAYLLEPIDISFRATGVYGEGRDTLPYHLAVPLKALADELGHFPFMEYASSYALVNYKRVVPGGSTPEQLGDIKSWETDNLRIIRAFEDPEGSEAGFILVHVSMVAYTGQLVTAAEETLSSALKKDREAFNKGLVDLNTAYTSINLTMDTMLVCGGGVAQLITSTSATRFRSFIFGSGPKKMNSMFPNGVKYEGVSEEPQYFRGESGANDSIVPLGDNLLEITAHLPKNELASILRDFRKYRPSAQRIYIENLEHRAVDAGIAKFAHLDDHSLGEASTALPRQFVLTNSLTQLCTSSPWIKFVTFASDTGASRRNTSSSAVTTPSRLEALLFHSKVIRAHAIAQKNQLLEEVAKLKAQVLGKDDKRVLFILFLLDRRPLTAQESMMPYNAALPAPVWRGKIAVEEAVTLPELISKCSAPAYSVGGLGDKIGRALVDIHGRIEKMDQLGIEHMILSETSPGPQGCFDQAEAEALATRANDYLAAECAKNSARFSAYGSLSMHDPNDVQSVDGPNGVKFYDQPEYSIFWKTIAELDTVVYIHPRTPTPEIVEKFWEGRKWLNGASLSFTFGVAAHVLGLCVNGVFDKHPNAKVMIGHGGEIIPYNLWRTNHRLESFARLRGMPMQHDLRHYLAKNIFITTSGFYSDPGMALAMTEVGADNILFAIDHPYEEMEPATTWFDALQMNNNDKQKIGRGNAIRLLKLKLSA